MSRSRSYDYENVTVACLFCAGHFATAAAWDYTSYDCEVSSFCKDWNGLVQV